jgi:hypothetical protein
MLYIKVTYKSKVEWTGIVSINLLKTFYLSNNMEWKLIYTLFGQNTGGVIRN